MIIFQSHLTNLDTLKTELVRYYDTGTYNQQITKADQDASAYLLRRVNENKLSSRPKKLAIVLDIDETSLSNYPNMLHMNFGGSSQNIQDAISQARDPAIQPTLQLFKTAEANKVAVFFITGRPETLRSPTVKNLDSAGYFAYNGLYLRPVTDKNRSVIPFKSSTRKTIEANGYDIVLNVGDQESDLAGGFSDTTVKLPNPFYFLA